MLRNEIHSMENKIKTREIIKKQLDLFLNIFWNDFEYIMSAVSSAFGFS